MRSTMLVLFGSLWAGSLWAVGLSAQELTAPAHRWSVASTAGLVLGGPAAAVRGGLEGIGWGGTAPGGCIFVFCSSGSDYPKGSTGGSGEVTVRYALTNRWAVAVGTTWKLELGTAEGYRQVTSDPYGSGNYLDSRFEGSSTWVAGHIGASGWLSAGAGVALHSIRSRDGDPFATAVTSSSYRRIGLIGEAALRLPRDSFLFWELTVRGHWIPGSVQWGSALGANRPLDVSLSYTTITGGVGLRF